MIISHLGLKVFQGRLNRGNKVVDVVRLAPDTGHFPKGRTMDLSCFVLKNQSISLIDTNDMSMHS